MKFRQDISPYRQNNNFNKLVRQFDVNSGFAAPYDDPDPTINQMTLQQRIDLAKALADALSTAAEVETANAENKKEIENLLLDQSELLIDALVAQQSFAAKLVEYEGVIGHIQDGLTHLRARSGCVFDFRLMSLAALLGKEWASNQDPTAVTVVFRANINGANAWSANGFRTASFLGRPVSATNWQVLVKAGAPENGMIDMDLQQLTEANTVRPSGGTATNQLRQWAPLRFTDAPM